MSDIFFAYVAVCVSDVRRKSIGVVELCIMKGNGDVVVFA